jgi:hypothetical protein
MASDRHATAELDWGQAVVRDGTLTLPLSQKASKRWVAEVESVLDRLAPRAEVDVGRERLAVAVQAGGEGDVRHLLESAVLEANSRLADEDHDDAGLDPDDAAMTATFRSFAPDAGSPTSSPRSE